MNSEQARTDAFLAFEVLSESHQNEPKATPLEKLDEWLPKVETSRAFWREPQLPDRLLQVAFDHVPIQAFLTYR